MVVRWLHYKYTTPALHSEINVCRSPVLECGKCRKLRVDGIALDRHMSEGGLDVAREEIEMMTGEQLPCAPRWIEADTLGERFDNGSIKRSTLVLAVKSKRAADAILTKGLSFGSRRHEAERFWERGEGEICIRCCGRGHFGKCTEEEKCFVCAGEHEGCQAPVLRRRLWQEV
jgi:hypothetical protein